MGSVKKEQRLTIRLTLELKDKLQVLADSQDRKLSDFVYLELVRMTETKLLNENKTSDKNE